MRSKDGSGSRTAEGKRFDAFIDDVSRVLPDTVERRLAEVQELLKEGRGRDLFHLTTFELMAHDFRENSHSNVLQYLFDHRLFAQGADLLADFVSGIDGVENKDQLVSIIRGKKYSVDREKPTKNRKYMDLFIHDNEAHMAIVIENKVRARVSEDEEGKLQLEHYADHIYNSKVDYQHKLFILLSWSPQDDYHEKGWKKTDYSYLYALLSKYDNGNDHILHEYCQLLSVLIGDPDADRRELIVLAKNIKHGNLTITLGEEHLLLEDIERIRRYL